MVVSIIAKLANPRSSQLDETGQTRSEYWTSKKGGERRCSACYDFISKMLERWYFGREIFYRRTFLNISPFLPRNWTTSENVLRFEFPLKPDPFVADASRQKTFQIIFFLLFFKTFFFCRLKRGEGGRRITKCTPTTNKPENGPGFFYLPFTLLTRALHARHLLNCKTREGKRSFEA